MIENKYARMVLAWTVHGIWNAVSNWKFLIPFAVLSWLSPLTGILFYAAWLVMYLSFAIRLFQIKGRGRELDTNDMEFLHDWGFAPGRFPTWIAECVPSAAILAINSWSLVAGYLVLQVCNFSLRRDARELFFQCRNKNKPVFTREVIDE